MLLDALHTSRPDYHVDGALAQAQADDWFDQPV